MPARDETTRTCCGPLALYRLLHDIHDDLDLLFFKQYMSKAILFQHELQGRYI
jgi:hypothetical protein